MTRRLRPARLAVLLVIAASSLAGAASAQASPFVYVADGGSANVSQYDGSAGSLNPLTPPAVSAQRTPGVVAFTPNGSYAYVTNEGSDSISEYAVGPDGALAPLASSPVTAGGLDNPDGIAISPSGLYAYVTNQRGNSIGEYAISVTGTLAPLVSSPVTTGGVNDPNAVAISPNGADVYVTNMSSTSSSVSEYAIGSNGALTALPSSPVTTGGVDTPTGLAIAPSGGNLYVSNGNASTVSEYAVGSDGALTPLPSSPVMSSDLNDPADVAINPSGTYAYVSNNYSDSISEFAIGSDGALSELAGSPLTTGGLDAPTGLATTPDGRYVYVANYAGDDVSEYSVGSGGALSPLASSPIVAGSHPAALVITNGFSGGSGGGGGPVVGGGTSTAGGSASGGSPATGSGASGVSGTTGATGTGAPGTIATHGPQGRILLFKVNGLNRDVQLTIRCLGPRTVTCSGGVTARGIGYTKFFHHRHGRPTTKITGHAFVGRHRFHIVGGHSRFIKIPIRGAAQRLLRNSRRVHILLVVTPVGGHPRHAKVTLHAHT